MSIRPTPFNVNEATTIDEIKAELGSGGSDPSVQFSYARIYCSAKVSAPKRLTMHLLFASVPACLDSWGIVLSSLSHRFGRSPTRCCVDNSGPCPTTDCVWMAWMSRWSSSYRSCPAPAWTQTVEPGSNHIHLRFCVRINSFSQVGQEVRFTYMQQLELDPCIPLTVNWTMTKSVKSLVSKSLCRVTKLAGQSETS